MRLVWPALFAAICSLACPRPCLAWLYDAGIAQYAGAMMKDGTSTEWVAAPFSVDFDSRATQFGAALSRAYGPQGAGFTVELAEWVNGSPGETLSSWTVVPTSAALVYYYWDAPEILLASKNKGHYYALVFKPNDPGLAGAISYSNKGGCYYGLGYGSNSGWFMLQCPVCIRVDGYQVPEACSFTVLVCGMGAFLRAARPRSRRLVRRG